MTENANPRAGMRPDGAHAVEVRDTDDDHTTRNALIGTDHARRHSNVSWGAIIAGVVTFLALTVLLSMGAAAMGLGGASGAATGIWTIVALAVALAAAGYVAGALAIRSGLLHGFLTWAASLLSVLVLAGWLGTSMLGAVGSTLGTVAGTADVSGTQVQEAAQQAQDQVSQQDVNQAQQQAEQGAQQAADATSTGLWWTFAGSLIGAAVAAATGAAGARSVTRKDQEVIRA